MLEYLKSGVSLNVSLIVLDVNMARLNGTETLRKLKEDALFRHIPVIIFSTSDNAIEKAICAELGALDYRIKPSRFELYQNVCREFYTIACATIHLEIG